MPHFTREIAPEGPIITAVVGVSSQRAAALQAAKQAVPALITLQGIIDTGASGTCVAAAVFARLGLEPRGVVLVNTPSTGAQPHQAAQYDASIFVPGATPGSPSLMLSSLPVLASDLSAQGIQILAGREVLRHCVLIYNGGTGSYTLAF